MYLQRFAELLCVVEVGVAIDFLRFVELIEIVGEMVKERLAGLHWLFFEGVDHDVCRLAETAHTVAIFVRSLVQRKSAVLWSHLLKEGVLHYCKFSLAERFSLFPHSLLFFLFGRTVDDYLCV